MASFVQGEAGDSSAVSGAGSGVVSTEPWFPGVLTAAVFLAVDPWNREHFLTVKQTILVVSAAAMVFFYPVVLGRWPFRVPGGMKAPLACGACWLAVTSVLGSNPGISARFLAVVVSAVLVYLWCVRAYSSFSDPASGIDRVRLPDRFIFFTAFATFAVSAYALVQALGFDISFWREYQGKLKVFSTIGNPNFLGEMLIVVLPAIAAWAIERGGVGVERTTDVRKSVAAPRRLLVFSWVSVASGYAALAATRCLGAWSAHLAASLILIMAWRRQRAFLKIAGPREASDFIEPRTFFYNPGSPPGPARTLLRGIAGALIAVFLIAGVLYGINLFSGEWWNRLDSKARLRVFLWANSAAMSARNPVLGVGPGCFGYRYLYEQCQILPDLLGSHDFQRSYRHAHCDLLELVCETGVPGLLLAAWLAVAAVRVAQAAEVGGLFNLGASIGLAGAGIHGLVSFPAHLPATLVPSVILLAWLTAGKARKGSFINESVSAPGLSPMVRVMACAASLGLFSAGMAWQGSEIAWSIGYRALSVSGGRDPDLSRAESGARLALRLWPGNGQALALLGRAAIFRGDLADAEDNLLKAISRTSDVRILTDLASVRFYKGDLAGSETLFDFVKSLRYGGELHKIYFNLGQIRMKMGRPLDAVRDFGLAIRLSPTSRETMMSLGEAMLALGDNRMAAAYFNDALSSSPEDPGALYNLGVALEAAGNLQGAESAYLQCAETAVVVDSGVNTGIVENGPESHIRNRARLNLGVLLFRTGRVNEAMTLWSRVMENPGAEEEMRERASENIKAARNSKKR